jgi:hypothetical protein
LSIETATPKTAMVASREASEVDRQQRSASVRFTEYLSGIFQMQLFVRGSIKVCSQNIKIPSIGYGAKMPFNI